MLRFHSAFISLVVLLCAHSLYATTDTDWRNVEARSENAVVQVWSQKAEFNWLDPYRNGDQGQGAGTGFFIDSKGHLLTNFHVVRDAKKVFINVPKVGKKHLEVSIVGVCPEVDIALLKLTEESYAAVVKVCGSINALELGNSDDLYATCPVLMLGYPKGVPSLKSTLGYIGGQDFIDGRAHMHTQTPMNPGNSGGPVMYIKDGVGKVMGIATGILKNSEGYGLIVPINDVSLILKDLFKTKFVRRPSMTFGANPSTDAHARSLKNPVPGGLYVNYVQTNSMEERAGLKVGDMIYEIHIKGTKYEVDEFGEVLVQWRNGSKITLEELLSRCEIHDPLKIVVYRNGQKAELTAKYEDVVLQPVRTVYPDYEPEACDYEMIGGAVFMQLRENHIGMLVKHNHFLANHARAENQSKPVVVITRIVPSSIAHFSECLGSGFVLEKVNGKTVTTLAEFREALMLSAKTNEIALETKEKYTTVLDLQKVLKDEMRLSRDFKFPITSTVFKLMEACGIVTKQQAGHIAAAA